MSYTPIPEEVSASTATSATLLSWIYRKLPRLDVASRMAVNVETGSVAVSSLPTLANVTTVGTVTNQTNLGGYSVANERFMQRPLHIYNNIIVS
jgi:hypothetical protein